MADRRPVPVLRPPPRPLSRPATIVSARPHRWRVASWARTSTASTGGGCTTAPRCRASRSTRIAVRDDHVRAPRSDRPLRLARRDRPLRSRRRAVDDRGQRHRPRRDVPAPCDRRAEHDRAVPDLDEPAGRRQDRRAALHDAVGPRHPAPCCHRLRWQGDGDHRRRRRARRSACPHAAAALVGGTADADVAHLARPVRPGRAVDDAAGAQPDTVRTLYVFDGSGCPSTGTRSKDRRRRGDPDAPVELVAEEGPSSCSCSRAARSANRLPSTGRS